MAVAMLVMPSGIFAATSCDSLAKPAFSCPDGYAIMCFQEGGDHWGCGRETPDGGTAEAPPVSEAQAADPVAAEPTAAPQEPAPVSPVETATTPEPAVERPVAAASAPTSTSALAQAAPVTAVTAPTTIAPEDAPPERAATAEPMTAPFEEAQELVEAVADEAPAAAQPYLYAIAGALAMLVVVLGVQEVLRRSRDRNARQCVHCGGTGHEGGAAVCGNCEGKGTVEEEYEGTVECAHCEGGGEDPCHECDGAGESRNAGEDVTSTCGACEGTGMGRDKEGGSVECCTCAGEGEATATLKRDVACPDCDGAKRL